MAEGLVGPDERVVLFNTGAAQKYVELLEVELPTAESDLGAVMGPPAGGIGSG